MPSTLNVIVDNSTTAKLLRSALYAPLVRKGDANRMEFILSDSFQRSADGLTSSFRIRKDIQFSNGSKIQGLDILSSLKECQDGNRDYSKYQVSTRIVTLIEHAELWLDIRAARGNDDVIEFVAGCPIVSKESKEIFGGINGTGTHIVGSGEYTLVGQDSGKGYLLQKSNTNTKRSIKESEYRMDFVKVPSLEGALSVLRRGEIDLFLTDGQDLSQRIVEDETLAMGACNGEKIVKRKSLEFTCARDFSIKKIGYDL